MKRSALLLFSLFSLAGCAQSQSQDTRPTALPTPKPGEAVATFAGGCFWATEAEFESLKGVREVISGYAGGTAKNPTYGQVGGEQTGHAESVQVYYDPKVVSFDVLLDAFFAGHNPTTPNRQGPDVGPQYRSVAFYRTPDEKARIEAAIKRASAHYDVPIVTQVVPFTGFYPAENYHQGYCKAHPNQPYIRQVSVPKIEKMRKALAGKLKEDLVEF
jgi:peptide-methionine (S)-S-oxide reductase